MIFHHRFSKGLGDVQILFTYMTLILDGNHNAHFYHKYESLSKRNHRSFVYYINNSLLFCDTFMCERTITHRFLGALTVFNYWRNMQKITSTRYFGNIYDRNFDRMLGDYWGESHFFINKPLKNGTFDHLFIQSLWVCKHLISQSFVTTFGVGKTTWKCDQFEQTMSTKM